jgi:hypothetical protein
LKQQIDNLLRVERLKWECLKNEKIDKESLKIKKKQNADVVKHNAKLKQGINDLKKKKIKENDFIVKKYKNKLTLIEKKYKKITQSHNMKSFKRTLSKSRDTCKYFD